MLSPMKIAAAVIRAMPDGPEKDAVRAHHESLREALAQQRRVAGLIRAAKMKQRPAA